jgi:hypothetical protein
MSSTHSHDSDHQKKPSELEHEVDQVRERLGRTVDALGSRFSPGEVIDQALGMAREHGGEFGINLGTQAKNNPVPLLLAGVGITWLMAASSKPPYRETNGGTPQVERGEGYDRNVAGGASVSRSAPATGLDQRDKDSVGQRARDGLVSAKDALSTAKDSVAEHSHSAADRVGEKLGSARETVSAQASSLQHSARQQASQLQHGFEGMLHEQPLMMGALGVALGAALGAVLPKTETEDRLMGQSRDTTLERGKEMAAEQYEKGRETVKETARQVEGKLKASSEATPGKDSGTGAGASPPRPGTPRP